MTANLGPVKVDDDGNMYVRFTGGATLTIAGPLGRAADAASLSAALSTEDIAILNAIMTNTQFLANSRCTITRTTVNSTNSSVTLLAANASRKSVELTHTDANALYLDPSGGTATSSNIMLLTNGYWCCVANAVPTNLLTGIWAADGAGVAIIYEGA